MLKKCDGVVNIADDIVVHGCDQEELDRCLLTVLECLQAAGSTLNSSKCEFGLNELVFYGHKLTSQGVRPSDVKIAAVQGAVAPTNVSEVRSFLGLVQYCSRFIPNLPTIAEPLQRLMRKNVHFAWSMEQQKAFEKLKKCLVCAETLAYFDPSCPTRIIADASPYGLGAVLTQCQQSQWRVIAYASRSLTDVERRYSQTEREALALVWACERLNIYVFGKKFELVTDHKPLQFIYSTTSKPSARVERWVLRLQAYDFEVVYTPGKSNIADCLSQLQARSTLSSGSLDIVHSIVENQVPASVTPREIEQASSTDSELSAVRRCVLTGDWTKCPNPIYLHLRHELCVYGKTLLRGHRIVIPEVL